MHFNLKGQGNSCQVAVEPPITFFKGDMFIRHEYRRTVQLKKMTNGIVKYKLRLEGQNRPFDIDILAGGVSLNQQADGLIQGEIKVEAIELQFVIKSQECGIALAYFYVEIEDGPPISFQCQADFRGPILETRDPVIKLGLAKVNTKKSHQIVLKNTSPISANYLIKSSKNQKLTFETAQHGEASNVSYKVGHPVVTSNGNRISVDKPFLCLEPNQESTVEVNLDCICEETV